MVAGQPLLFDRPPQHCLPVRASDPITSQIAADELISKLSACQTAFVLSLKVLGVPSTASEVANEARARYPRSNAETYRKRAAECVRCGAIKEAGRRECFITGKLATTYIVA